jgi:hypothetical protein
MYTKQEALDKINSEQFQIEIKIDKFLKENYKGEEIAINLNEYGWALCYKMMDLYKSQGWGVRLPNINPDNARILYFS